MKKILLSACATVPFIVSCNQQSIGDPPPSYTSCSSAFHPTNWDVLTQREQTAKAKWQSGKITDYSYIREDDHSILTAKENVVLFGNAVHSDGRTIDQVFQGIETMISGHGNQGKCYSIIVKFNDLYGYPEEVTSGDYSKNLSDSVNYYKITSFQFIAI